MLTLLITLSTLSTLSTVALAQGAPDGTERGDDDSGASEGVFGSDISAGVAPGALLGEWPAPGLHGAFVLRYDAFIEPRDAPGVRMGLSVFGGRSVWPLQDSSGGVDAEGNEELTPFSFYHYGALAVMRYAPAAPWGGTFGVGFSRIDIEDYQGGPLGLPVFLLEGGARRRIGSDGQAFLDLMMRGGWGSAAGIEEPTEWSDWWLVQPVVALGVHLK